MELKKIAVMSSDFATKFGLPRQSLLVEEIVGSIVFEKEYSIPEAFRGIEEFSHLHIIWGFSECQDKSWSATVRPPRLGGNKRMGVFATRSPYRPNSVGLSIVKLLSVEKKDGRMVLNVSGADLMDGTPIYDIKPYLSFSDAHPEAKGGFADKVKDYNVNVIIPPELENILPDDKTDVLKKILSQDPRPSYQNDGSRIYGFEYCGYEVNFKVKNNVATVCKITKKSEV